MNRFTQVQITYVRFVTKKIGTRRTLLKHERIHSGENDGGKNPLKTEEKNLEENHKGSYSCSYCNYSHKHPYRVKKHERIHTG